jgi:hypothetical protein
MALYLKDPGVDRAVRELAALEHCSITEAVGRAVETRRKQIVDEREEKRRKVKAIQAEVRALPILDPRDHAEMLYDENGLPK